MSDLPMAPPLSVSVSCTGERFLQAASPGYADQDIVYSGKDLDLIPSTNRLPNPSPNPLTTSNGRASNGRIRTLNDDLWDALTEVVGYEPQTDEEKALRGKLIRSFKGAGATPETIKIAGEQYIKEWGEDHLTETALVKHYSRCLSHAARPVRQAEPKPKLRYGRGLTTRMILDIRDAHIEQERRDHDNGQANGLLP